VLFDRLAEAVTDGVRLTVLGEIANHETELVAAEACVQLVRARAVSLSGDDVAGTYLLSQQMCDAGDDSIADRVAESIVVQLEAGDVDQADRAPAAALLEREERLELLEEVIQIHQPRLGIPVRQVGEVCDERF